MVKIIRRNPFSELERFFDDQDFCGMMPAVRRYMEPPMEVYQTDAAVVVEMHVANIDPSSINVSVENGMLKIEGATEDVKEDSGREYFRKEIKSGSFARVMTLPMDVKEDQIEASVEKGILKVTMPKTEVKQPKKVEVKIK